MHGITLSTFVSCLLNLVNCLKSIYIHLMCEYTTFWGWAFCLGMKVRHPPWAWGAPCLWGMAAASCKHRPLERLLLIRQMDSCYTWHWHRVPQLLTLALFTPYSNFNTKFLPSFFYPSPLACVWHMVLDGCFKHLLKWRELNKSICW